MNNRKDGKKEKNVYAYGGAGTYTYTLTAMKGLRHCLCRKKIGVWTFQTRFRPEDSQLSAQNLISCLAVVVRIQQKKSEWMPKKLQT
jgi:hypothetical protein